MKKTCCTQFLTFALFLFSSFTAIGQGYILQSNDDGTGCNGSNINVHLRTPLFYIANLALNPNSGGSAYVLPTGTPSMFLQRTGIGPVVNVPVDNFVYAYSVNGHSVYRMPSIFVPVDFDAACEPHSGNTRFDFTWRLVDQYGNNYPIHNGQFSNPSGIFSCEVFALTCHNCDDGGSCSGAPGQYPSADGFVCYDCEEDGFGTFFPIGDRHDGGNTHNASLLSVTPNPFQDHLALEYTIEQTANVTLTIFNTQGQLMVNSQEVKEAGVYRKRFDTQQWSSGIYYCKIQSGENSQFVKLVKVN